MNLDELMAVWKTQDAAPLHDVNKTLLHLALRQDEAQMQKRRRRERWIHYASSAFVIGLLSILLTLMIHVRGRDMMTGWDYAMGIAGVAAALFAGGVTYARRRAQARREQHFGESLRDQINRRIVQLDDTVTGVRLRRLSFVSMGGVCPLAILHLGLRINHKTLGDARPAVVILLILCFLAGARSIRRAVQRAGARKRELEALLKELDSQ